ncbi:MAG: dicarboxylate/amino acid:cation symporter, partial [Prevotellaceae bacterium]|nr:dicarboxylate/amino acid:cation symporter [Prevotellaceae bacterium]
LAVPTIVLAVITTLSTLGAQKDSGRIFRTALKYTVLTTLSAAAVGLILYIIVAPGNLPEGVVGASGTSEIAAYSQKSYADHFLSVVPNNIVRPFLEGNVLSLILIAFAVGMAFSRMKRTEGVEAVLKLLFGLQELLFHLIHWLIWTLPLGILAFSAQLASQLTAGVAAESLGKYILVIIGGNCIQFFVVLPLFLLARGLNPVHVLSKMMPAVLMALFTKSSAATLPVTMETAEKQLGVSQRVARFVLPICTTVNMNGCAAFILVTSLFVMQNGGIELTLPTMLLWLLLSVVSAIGNAGVPMGCFFLTLSLMSGIGAPVAIMGIILPVYTIIDMIETAENVWSDSCVAAMTHHDVK